MFNKPGVFNRNDALARRDGLPVLTSASSSGRTGEDPARTAATAIPAGTAANDAPPAKDAPPPVASAATGEMGARLIVGPDVKLKGAEILDCDTLVVEGRVEATMDSRVIRIADAGSFAGKVSIDVAEIHGRFEGELTARSQLIIHSTGRVSGKIRYGKLVIDEGGELCGEISALGGDAPASQATAPRLRAESPLPLSVAG